MDPDLEYVETDEHEFGYPVFEVWNERRFVGRAHRTNTARWKGTAPGGRTVTATTRKHVGIVMAQWDGA